MKVTRVLQMSMFVLTACFCFVTAQAQTPLPSPSPDPTPITKTGNILVNNRSTVGRISKWVASSSNGTGTIGDSVIVESSIGTVGIGTNPFSDFKFAVDGGNTLNGLVGRTSATGGIGVLGISPIGAGYAGFFQGNVNVNGTMNVTTINAVNLSTAGTINTSTNPIDWTKLKNVPSSIASGLVVNSVNGLSSAVTLAAGDNVTITPSGNTLTITASGGGSLADGSVTTAKLADGAVTAAKLASGVGPLRVIDNANNEVGIVGGVPLERLPS